MAKREEQEENYWPGFVDALSTIVMVVTFIMIIFAIIIFVLSQKIAKESQQSSTEKHAESQIEMSAAEVITQQKPSPPKDTEIKTEEPTEEIEDSQKVDIIEGQFKINRDLVIKSEDETEKEIDLAVRSKEVVERRDYTVTSDEIDPEQNKENQKVIIQQASDLVTLNFKPLLVEIDKETTENMTKFIQESKEVDENSLLEIWSFASLKDSGISSARRAAYFRAMNARNILLQSGINPEKISVRVRETDDPALKDQVKVLLK